MEITKKSSEYKDFGDEITFKDKDKIFRISFEGNLDLYFSFHSYNKEHFFEITKENYYIYEVFLNLYNNIKSNNLYEVDEIDISLHEPRTLEDLNYIYEDKKELNDWVKKGSRYDELYHDGIITWKSDDSWDDYYNRNYYVSIIKKENSIVFNFDDIESYVRFRNSGSYYDPYNILFMEAFNKLMKYDPNDGQIHIEEYLYEKERIRTRK